MRRSSSNLAFIVAGLVVAVALAVVVSGFASSSPDGLERVAADEHLDRGETDHALADSPLADYGVSGVDNARAGTAVAGLVGVAITFVVAVGLFAAVGRVRGGTPPADQRGPAEA